MYLDSRFRKPPNNLQKKREVEEKEAEIKQQQADESLREGDTDNGRLNPIRETFIL